MKTSREIRVFCHEHGKVFSTTAKAQILCSASNHTIARDFPNGETWEHCCDCETFFRCRIGEGEDTRKKCPVCNRSIQRRYLCQTCSVVSFESNESPPGKHAPDIDSKKGLAGVCPGCGETPAAPVRKHECEKTGAEFLSPRESCLFCKQKIGEDLLIVVFTEQQGETPITGRADENLVCLNETCGREFPASSMFCGFCGTPVSSEDTVVVSRKRRRPRSVVSDSRCPNCLAISPWNGAFCTQCGQGLDWPDPRAAPLPVNIEGPAAASLPEPEQIVGPGETESQKKRPLALIGCMAVFLLFGALLVIGIGSIGLSSNVNAYPSPSVTPSYNSARSTPSYNSGTPAANTPYNVANMNTGNLNRSSNANTPANSSDTSLTRYFKRAYEGSINNTNNIDIKLERNDDSLSGEVIPKGRYSTLITVNGTIENDGSFEITEYDDEENPTGRYTGRIRPNGTIEGTWTKPDGSQPAPFYLSQKMKP